MRVFYSFMGRKYPLFLPSMMILGCGEGESSAALNAKNKLGKSFKVCLEYNKDLKSKTLRDSMSEGKEGVTVP